MFDTHTGDFAILLQSGFSRKGAMLAQFSTAIGAMLGCIVGTFSHLALLSSFFPTFKNKTKKAEDQNKMHFVFAFSIH